MGLEGIVPVLPMPFDADGVIAPAELDRVTTFLLARPVAAIAFGFASEVARLTDTERDLALHVAAGVVAGSRPIIATIQAGSTVALVRRAEAARMNGATMLMVTPPPGAPVPPDDLVSHFDSVAREIGLPLIVQDAPGQSGVEMPVSRLARLAIEIPGVIAVKTEAPPTAPKVGALVDAIGPAAAVLGGAGGMDFFNELNRGAAGTLPGAAFPELFVTVFQLYRSGQLELARAAFAAILPLVLVSGRDHDTFCHAQKFILRRRGILNGVGLRSPAPALDPRLDGDLQVALADVARAWRRLDLELPDPWPTPIVP